MITTAKQLTWPALEYARKDLREVIELQEKAIREHGAGACPKLGAYWDELSAVLGEIRRRQAASLKSRAMSPSQRRS